MRFDFEAKPEFLLDFRIIRDPLKKRKTLVVKYTLQRMRKSTELRKLGFTLTLGFKQRQKTVFK